ncbi:MAG: putative FAD-linked oxidoreductase [bacterium ADurb.BinA186]|nr:MAG: putative FAD-linked oxidoreductase [bacterium ADurb.BinA186]
MGGAQKQIEAIAETLNGLSLHQEFASTPQERLDLWHTRSNLSAACSSFLGHKLSEDMAIPLCSLQEFAQWFKDQEHKPHLLSGLFGHAGDGNLHVQIMFDDKKHTAEAQNLRHNLLLKVLSLGGTLSAEHGIGLQKKSYLPLEQSKALIDVQKRIKKAFDPYNLLNPGKIFDI